MQDGNRALCSSPALLIGLLTAKGIPMLWQGQEFGENYWCASRPGPRHALPPVRGITFMRRRTSTVALVATPPVAPPAPEFRAGQHFFYNDWDRYQSRGRCASRALLPAASGLVALNFGDADQTVPFWFPIAGSYVEQLNGNPSDLLQNVDAGRGHSPYHSQQLRRIWDRV